MKNYALILTILMTLLACNEEQGAEPEPTPSEMLTRSWQVQSVLIDGTEDNTTNYSNFRFTFNTDQTYRFLMPDERAGSWQLIGNATSLVLDEGTEQEERVSVFELSETSLELEFTEESQKVGITRTRFLLVP